MNTITITKDDVSLYSAIFDVCKLQKLPLKHKIALLNLAINGHTTLRVEMSENSILSAFTAVINLDGTLKQDVAQKFLDLLLRHEQLKRIKHEETDYDKTQSDKQALTAIPIPLTPTTTIREIYKLLYETNGMASLYWSSVCDTIPITPPDATRLTLQRTKITINAELNTFPVPAKLAYHCEQCGHDFVRSKIDVWSTNGRARCDNLIPTNQGHKECGATCTYPTEETLCVQWRSYDATYIDEHGEVKSCIVESPKRLDPFEYDSLYLYVHDQEDEKIVLLDTKPVTLPTFNVDPQPKPNGKMPDDNVEAYIYAIDQVIYEQTGNRLVGFLDIKFALMCQKLCHVAKLAIDDHVAIVGDKGIGKTFVTEHYCTLFYGGRYKSTDGQSVTIPSLRGSAKGNREIMHGNKNRPGLLSMYNCILIDEIGQNKTNIIEDLKGFLLRPTYSNDTADGDKIQRLRTAHVNITENPNEEILGMYQGEIAKLYESYLADPTLKPTQGDSPEKWSYEWNLYQPLHTYTNPLLRRAIATIRLKYEKKKIHFLDGHTLSTHDRWPYYFVINSKMNDQALRERAALAARKLFTSAKGELLVRSLYMQGVDDWFMQFIPYLSMHQDDVSVAPMKIYDIIKSYGFVPDSRLTKTCTKILMYSKAFNKRDKLDDVDYNHVKRFLSVYNREVYLDELYTFTPIEPTKLVEQPAPIPQEPSMFSLPENEF